MQVLKTLFVLLLSCGSVHVFAGDWKSMEVGNALTSDTVAGAGDRVASASASVARAATRLIDCTQATLPCSGAATCC